MTFTRLTDSPLRTIIQVKPPSDECISHLTLVGFSWFNTRYRLQRQIVVHITLPQWTSLISPYLLTYIHIYLFIIIYLFIYIFLTGRIKKVSDTKSYDMPAILL